jgi:hypothetical protein
VAAIAEGVAKAANVRKAMPVTIKVLKLRRRPRGASLRPRWWGCEETAVVDTMVLPKDRHGSSVGNDKRRQAS